MNESHSADNLTQLCATNPYFPKMPWLQTLQKEQVQDFIARGFPTRYEEQWKYTDTTAIAKKERQWASSANIQSLSLPTAASFDTSIQLVFIDGYFCKELSDTRALPNEVILLPISEAFITHENLLKSQIIPFDAKSFPFASLNTALMSDGIILSVPKHLVLSTPIHCLYLNSTKNAIITCPYNIILAQESCELTFIEEYAGTGQGQNYMTNAVTRVHAQPNAKIDHYKIQTEDFTATHLGHIFVRQEQDSIFNSFNLSVGGHLSRDYVRVALQDKGAACHLNGYYKLTQDGQHIDNQLHVDHLAEHGTSTMLYKGILDKKSRGVFNGKVYVHPNAQKTNAQQSNHNLLLSPLAEINTKPELEIYADDVKCAHGATIGQLDLESLFYLQSRGIEKNTALTLLTHAFVADVFSKIVSSPIRHYIERLGGQHAQ